jgi:hypothetical protein
MRNRDEIRRLWSSSWDVAFSKSIKGPFARYSMNHWTGDYYYAIITKSKLRDWKKDEFHLSRKLLKLVFLRLDSLTSMEVHGATRQKTHMRLSAMSI